MRRVASVYLPYWSTDRLRRKTVTPPPDGGDPDRTAPLVTVLPDHGRRMIAAADAAARDGGIAAGMTLTKARALLPGLVAVDADPDADLLGLHRLALWAGRRYTPLVAPDPPDGLWLDLTGCAGLFGSERALLRDLHRRLAGAGLSVQIAAADTAGCAHAVAHYVPAGRPVTIAPGDHGTALALLPIAALRLERSLVDGLRKLGFERIEQLIGTPRAPLAKRFGPTLHRRLDQALGHKPEPVAPLVPDALPCARRGFLEPIMTADAFAQVISDLADNLAVALTGLGLGARRLDCHFHRVDGQPQAIRIGTAAPTRDPRHLAKLLAAGIKTIDPGLGVEAMTLVASLVERLHPRQAEGLASPGPHPSDLAALVDALANRFGQRRLWRAVPQASVMPERSVTTVPALGAAPGRAWDDDLPRPSHMLASPEPIEVTAMLPDHPPAMFLWRGRRFRVARADGPERLHGEWWRDHGIEAESPFVVRDYFQVETSGGGRYWIFRLGDGETAVSGPMRWFVHGAFA